MTLRLYIYAAATAAILGAVAYVRLLHGQIGTLEHENKTLTILRNACNERVINLLEDKESDNEIDNIPDADLRHVPDGWLLPQTGSSGVE